MQDNPLFKVDKDMPESSGPLFCDGFSEKLSQLVQQCQQSNDISAIPSIQQSLSQFASKFDSEIQKIRVQCSQVQQLKKMLAAKVDKY